MKMMTLCSFALLALLPSCALLKKKPKPIKVNRNVRLAGRVHQVDLNAKFVLIRRYGPWRVGDGEVVESRGEGRTASLQPTGEKLGEHVAADIRSGNVEIGDGVYIRKIAKAETAQTSTNPEKPAQANSQPKTPETP